MLTVYTRADEIPPFRRPDLHDTDGVAVSAVTGEGLDVLQARLAAHLRRAGLPIGSHDLLIASTAITHGYAVATENAREFTRVPGLEVRVTSKGGSA